MKCCTGLLAGLETKLKDSQSGLLEYKRRNPHGIENQVWKDSKEFYVHQNKKFANHNAPIASIEVQALVYDALMSMTGLFPDQAAHYRTPALKLREQTIELLWLPKAQFFALGADYDSKGKLRVIKTMSANPAALLDSRFFDGLPVAKQQLYITALVRTIMGPEFLTDGGIRSRALGEAKLVSFWDYHGSYTTWPKETYDIAKGLRRQGFPKLARQLENRLINVIFKSQQYPEFVYVDPYGRVLTSSPGTRRHGEVALVESTNRPESVQAWTVSAMLAITSRRIKTKLGLQKEQKATHWQQDLEKLILSQIPWVDRLLNPFALAAKYPSYSYTLTKTNTFL